MKFKKISGILSTLLLGAVLISHVNADDVLVSGAYPWLEYNDSSDDSINWRIRGYKNYYGLYDMLTTSSPGSPVFRIMHSANSTHSFQVDSHGDINLANGSVWIDRSTNKIGIGTVTPEAVLHGINTTTRVIGLFDSAGEAMLRLDAAGNSSWKMGSKYTRKQYMDWGGIKYRKRKFFTIEDINSSTTPFKIFQKAPTGALSISNGINSMGQRLTVDGTVKTTDVITSTWSGANTARDGTKYLIGLSTNNSDAAKTSDAGFSLENRREGFKWEFRTYEAGQGFIATKALSGGGEFRVENTTDDFHNAKVIVGDVTIFEDGHIVTASSRELKTDIKPLDTQAALDALHKLQPVSYEYKTQKGEPVVGFIAEDIPDLVAMPSRKSLDSTEIVAVLTSVVKEQEKSLAETRSEMKAMRAEIAELRSMRER